MSRWRSKERHIISDKYYLYAKCVQEIDSPFEGKILALKIVNIGNNENLNTLTLLVANGSTTEISTIAIIFIDKRKGTLLTAAAVEATFKRTTKEKPCPICGLKRSTGKTKHGKLLSAIQKQHIKGPQQWKEKQYKCQCQSYHTIFTHV